MRVRELVLLGTAAIAWTGCSSEEVISRRTQGAAVPENSSEAVAKAGSSDSKKKGKRNLAPTTAQVQKILNARCIACHQGPDAAHQLDLSDVGALIAPAPNLNLQAEHHSHSGIIIVAGEPSKSLLYTMISSRVVHPDDNPVPAGELAVIKAWIKGLEPNDGNESDEGNGGDAESGEPIAGPPDDQHEHPAPAGPGPMNPGEGHMHPEPNPTMPVPPGSHDHSMDIVIDDSADTIVVHGDRIPNFVKAPTHLIEQSGRWSQLASLKNVDSNSVVMIAEGHSVIFDVKDVAIKALGVSGELKFDPDIDTALTVQELIVFPTGYLEIGTRAAPIGSGVRAAIIIGDRPLDLAGDPEQFGNGVLVLGKVIMYGHALNATFVGLTKSPKAGDTSLTVALVPKGWQVGDRIAIPQTKVDDSQPLTEQFTITSITGTKIGLDHPVEYERPPAVDGDLVTVTKGYDGSELRGHVANLTRNISVRSENPKGTRGHFMALGRAYVDIRYAAFESLGRTTIADLDSTVLAEDGTVTHLGKNQIARYPLHTHHVMGPAGGLDADPSVDPAGLPRRQFRLIGNTVTGGLKWGITIHASHFGQISANVVHEIQGAGIVTEDGSETLNNIADNFVLGVEGRGTTERYDEEGRRGAGYWLRGNYNYFSGNITGAAEEGFGFYIQNATGNSQQAHMRVRIPKFPGADTHVDGQYEVRSINSLPLPMFRNNESYAITQFGIGIWSIQALPKDKEPVFKDTVIWNSTGTAVFLDYSTGRFNGLLIRGHASYPTPVAVRGHNANGASGPLTIQRFDIQQVRHAYTEDSRTIHALVFEDGYMRNYKGFVVSTEQQSTHSRRYIFRNVRFDPVAGHPLSVIQTDFDNRWKRGPSYMTYVLHDIQILMYDYQGMAGANFRVFFPEQDPQFVIDRRSITALYTEIKKWQIGGRWVPIRHRYYRIIGSTEPITVAEAWERHRSVLMNTAALDADAGLYPGISGPTAPLAGEDAPAFNYGPANPIFMFKGNLTENLGDTVELNYRPASDVGADGIYFRLDDGPWQRDADDDGIYTIPGLASGSHKIESAYGNATGDLWGSRVPAYFTVK